MRTIGSFLSLVSAAPVYNSNTFAYYKLQWSETGMEDPQDDTLAVHCFCVCSGSALLGDLLGVNRSRERDLLSVLSIYPRIFLCVFIVYRRVVRILCLLLYPAIC